MFSFGKRSEERLVTTHEDIQKVMRKAIQFTDFSIVEGLRSAETQNKYYNEGHSQLDGIVKLSWHQDRFNDGKSRAVDIAPYRNGIVWHDEKLWRSLAKIVFRETQFLIAKGELTHYIEWGGLWRNFLDRPHWQIKSL